MKVKMKLDLASIQSWLLAHGEKVACAVVGVVFLLFAWSAISRETLDASKQPEKMIELASRVQQHVGATKFDPQREQVQPVNYAERAKSKPLEVKLFALDKPFDGPVADPKAKRPTPPVLPAEELRVAAGYDAFEFKPAGASGQANTQNVQLRPQAWAVVTALVPYEKQRQAFDQAFARAVGANANRDVPTYLRPVLQRTEVDPANPQKENWTNVAVAPEFEEQLAGKVPEFVSKKYTDDLLTAALPPLHYNTWGEMASHPKVLSADEENRRQSQQAVAPPPTAAADVQPVANRNGVAAPANQPTAPAEPVVEHRLLRAFDYTVAPGKKYRYRVVLEMKNPNFKQPAVYLANPEHAAQEKLVSQPSAPTGVVTIPDGHRVLAGKIDAGPRFGEPSATIAVTAFDPKEGLQAGAELNVRRGVLANAMKQDVSVRAAGGELKKLTLDFKSDILVVDIFGGKNLPGKRRVPPLTAPGEILLLDSDGNLTVRSELDDRQSYDKTVVRPEPEPKPEPEEKKDDKPSPKRGPLLRKNAN